MDTFTNFLVSIVSAAGGAGFVGLLLINRFMDSLQENRKQMIEFENSIKLLEKSMHNENLLHVSKIQYEKEFIIYLELWEAMCECTDEFRKLVYLPNEALGSQYVNFTRKSSERYGKIKAKFEPFMKNELNNYLVDYSLIINEFTLYILEEIGNEFRTKSYNERKEHCLSQMKRIDDIILKFKEELKSYLVSFKIN